MPNIVISDTSSLILFDKIGEFELLNKVYELVFTTPQIVIEFGTSLPDWIKIVEVKDEKYLKFLKTQVDAGEASAIALATEIDNSILLLDDLKARKIARSLNLKFTGTLGVFHKAKQLGIIDKIRPLTDKLLMTNFRISDKIIKELLMINKELDD
jgi:predicted nucleic acid-binding protein